MITTSLDEALRPGTVFQVTSRRSPSYGGIFVVADTRHGLRVLEVTGAGRERHVEPRDIPTGRQRKILFRHELCAPQKIAEELRPLKAYLVDAVEQGLEVYLMGDVTAAPLWVTYKKTDNPLFLNVRYVINDGSEEGVKAKIGWFILENIGIIDRDQVRMLGTTRTYAAELSETRLTADRARAAFDLLAPYSIRLDSRYLVNAEPILGGTMQHPSVNQLLHGYVAEEGARLAFGKDTAPTRIFSSLREAHQTVLGIEGRIRETYRAA